MVTFDDDDYVDNTIDLEPEPGNRKSTKTDVDTETAGVLADDPVTSTNLLADLSDPSVDVHLMVNS